MLFFNENLLLYTFSFPKLLCSAHDVNLFVCEHSEFRVRPCARCDACGLYLPGPAM